jgi:hypothetical protein
VQNRSLDAGFGAFIYKSGHWTLMFKCHIGAFSFLRRIKSEYKKIPYAYLKSSARVTKCPNGVIQGA